MKQKLTYFLLTAVFFVWGIILYRIYFSNAVVDTPSNEKVNQPEKQINSKKYSLILNYRDPFFGGFPKRSIETTTEDTLISSDNKKETSMENLLNWDFIKYKGLIQNPSVNVVLLNINNKDFMFKNGENIQGVTLLESNDQYVKISYQGQIKNIYK